MASTVSTATQTTSAPSPSAPRERLYTILRYKDDLDENALSMDARGSAKDLIKVKYRTGDKRKTIYLQSASCTLRSPLTVDGETQKYVDFDLWETSSKQNREFVRKIESIEHKVVEFLSRNIERETEGESAKRLLKSSLRTLQKAKKASMPAFRLSTEDFYDEGLFNTEGKDVADLEDVRVQFIAELAGVRVARRNGLAVCVWKLSQLRVLPDAPQKDANEEDRIEKGVSVFEVEEDDEEVA
jgi:vacuolar-type H+-ATPase subunit I/STV1